ncbi:MAG: hypothetical protein ACJA2S_002155 [Cyclobacteriaceae bacterium]|jgi:hypothetical protein
MKFNSLLIGILLVAFGHNAHSQKLKYKDIFPLIENKDYETAITQINAFLSNSKNDDHANANLQKGLYFERKTDEFHVISDSIALLASNDSAIHYLRIAKTLITDKELSKNDEYYQAYYRRDLRTGDFDIKLSDVQLDIEKKLLSMENLNKYARIIHQNLKVGNRSYTASNEQYRHLITLYGDENEFALMSSELEQADLEGMITRSDSITSAMDMIRDAVSKLGKKGYSPEINFIEIKEFGVEGKSKTDFYANDIKVWDYSLWSQNLQSKVRMDVNKMRDKLNTTYSKLKSNYDMAKMGGGINENDLVQNLDPTLKSQLRKLDKNPLPEKLLDLLIDETKFEFITSKKLNTRLADENDVNYQIMVSDSINTIIDDISDKVSVIIEPYTTVGAKKYPKFIAGNYGGEFGLIKYKQATENKYAKEKNKWKELSSYWNEKSKWGVSEDLADSIYLIPKTDSSYMSMEFSKFYTLSITEDDSLNIYALGLEFQGDADKGYLAKIGNDRIIKWKVNFDLDKFVYDDEVLKVSGSYAPSSEGSISGYLYNSVPESENNFILLNCESTGELNWSSAAKITNEPVSIKFNDIVKETNVFLMEEEALESYDGEDPIYVVFDRKGTKVR